jgi:hypothetical protein
MPAYQKPRIVDLGAVNALTRGSTGPGNDQGKGNGSGAPGKEK